MQAVTTYAAICMLYARGRRTTMPASSLRALRLLLFVASGQVALGVGTLLSGVPMALASAHQLGALLTFTGAWWAAATLRWAKYVKA